ncbi:MULTISPECIES: 4'-phosphopantetheinyl transferase superfamily protein [unclassified Pedobacter]|uniref:4'-phosphopantetheinyl transferase family protein n=1 Tax=unclassified Pedobacter TaxID=2628915 RepID=UPI001E354BA3|nr:MULTISPECIES: 4'-phosphopantetheinyl transferase superfamily protein [unclassified Pedobacter]
MLGNDIVDLKLAKTQSNWQRSGFLNKIFTKQEQFYIRSSENPDRLVWLLWSMKEAAYKIHNRITGVRNFAPTSLECSIRQEDLKKGAVCIDAETYYTESDINDDYVHTVASCLKNHCVNVKTAIYKAPNLLADYKNTSAACVSHHGRYLALVY